MSDEELIQRRFAFAMSSFGRMFRPPGITKEMTDMCRQWAENVERATPMHNDLPGVDEYFLEMWRSYSES